MSRFQCILHKSSPGARACDSRHRGEEVTGGKSTVRFGRLADVILNPWSGVDGGLQLATEILTLERGWECCI